jgi:hypothetical protein
MEPCCLLIFSTGIKLQEAFNGRMWISLLCDFPFNTPNPLQLGTGVSESITKFKDAGFQGKNIFLAGHSLGGKLCKI